MSSLPGLSRAQPPDRGQPTRATGEHPGAPSCWLLAPSPRWAGFGIRLWTQSVSQLVPQDMQACHPKDKGPRNPPPPSSCLLHSSLLTSSLPLPRERPLLPSEFPQPPLSACPPETVSPRHWHRPHPSCQGRLLPGEPADPHVFTQARGAGLTQT